MNQLLRLAPVGAVRRLKAVISLCLGRAPRPVRGQGAKRIICYLGGVGWSLGFVWRGLQSSAALCCDSDRPETFSCSSADDLRRLYCGGDAFVLIVTQGQLADVLAAGIPPERIIYYFAHVCLDKNLPKLKRLHAVLTQSMFEYNLTLIRGVESSKVHFSPQGLIGSCLALRR